MEKGQIGRRGRGGKEWCWDYFEVTVTRNRDGRQRPSTAVCTICRNTVSPKIERIREHFNRFHPNLVDDNGRPRPQEDNSDDLSEHKLSLSQVRAIDSKTSRMSEAEICLRKELSLRKDTTETVVDEKNIDISPNTSTVSEKGWIFKYYTSTDTEDLMTCNLCKAELKSETSLLTSHLFDVHSDNSHDEHEIDHEAVDLEQCSRRTSDSASSTTRRPKASVWNHFETVMVDGPDTVKVPKVKCKVCLQIVSPKVERLRRHILENHAELADEETEERFLASKEATKVLLGRGDIEQIQKARKVYVPAPASVKSLSELSMKKDAEGKKALIWAYFEILHSSDNAENRSKPIGAQCKICETLVSPKIERLRRHFLNNHTDILMSSDAFDVQTVLDDVSKLSIPSINIKTENENKTEKAELEWTRKYFDLRNNQSQCRLCLDIFEPQTEYLYQHLKVSHQGILEFGDNLPVQQIKQENLRDGDIEPVETTAEFEWEDAEEMTEPDPHESDEQCLSCGRGLRAGRHTHSIRMWDKGCAESLCQVFSLNDSFSQYFEAGKYCDSCQQVVRNIDFTQRAINRFRTVLSSYRHTYESLILKRMSSSRGRKDAAAQKTLDELYKGIFGKQKSLNRKRQKSFPLTKRPLKRSRTKSPYEEDLDDEKQEVVEYTSKYGRTCTSLALRDLQPACEEADHGDFDGNVENNWRNTASSEDDWVNSGDETNRKKQKKVAMTWRSRKPKVGRKRISASKPKFPERSSSTKIGPAKLRPKFVCEVSGCNFSSYQKSWLDVHVRSRHDNDETPYHCECGEKFINMTSYGLHQRIHILLKKNQSQCITCKKSFPDKQVLKEHREEAHRRPVKIKVPEVERCSFCCFVIEEGQVLVEHEKLHEAKVVAKVPYDCVICNSRVFTNTLTLQAHVKTVHNPNVNGPKCETCDKVFKSLKILRRHKKRAHVDDIEGPNWKCSECGLVSVDRAAYRAHFKEHAKPRPFLCAECGMTFKSKSNLRIHNMLHTGERPWKCKLCPKGFNQSSKLRAHEETHVEMKTYVCDKCGKAFRTARNIYQHQKFHCHPDGQLKGQDGSMTVPKKRRRERRQRLQEPHESEESSASLASIPINREQEEGHFQERHHLGLPGYLPSGTSTLSEMVTIDTRGSGIPFIGTHGHHVQSGYNVPIWIAHGQQSLTMDSSHSGRM